MKSSGRERAKSAATAILYNRSHEIVSGAKLWLNRDWMWTFLGLRNAQIRSDVIIEEDLAAETLAPYEVLYVSGLNLERRHVAALRAWVERGGLLIGSGGCALSDVYGDRQPATEELFGAAQRLASTEVKPRGSASIFKAAGSSRRSTSQPPRPVTSASS